MRTVGTPWCLTQGTMSTGTLRSGDTETRVAESAAGDPGLSINRAPGPPAEAGLAQSRRLVAAQRVSSLRLDNCSLRSTFDAWDSTVFTEMNSREPISR